MPDIDINLGRCFTATGTAEKYNLLQPPDAGYHRGSIKNNGGSTVFFGWNTPIIAADTTDAAEKGYALAGEAVRVPRRCSSFYAQTGGASCKCVYIED